MIYLDNSATTKTHPDVISVMTDVMNNIYGNPSSLHGLGVKAERLVEQARRVIAKKLDCHPSEILFTSGGTEANNLAIKGVADQLQSRGRHLITTSVEHPSVFEVMKQLEEKGWKVTYLPVDSWGRVSPDAVEKALTDETVLVSIMHVNNEVGTIQPIHEIGQRLAKYPKILFHVDAVQSFAKIPLKPKQAGIDLLSVSAHKFHGPKGIGALYIRKNVEITPLLVGGGQERGFRSGTHHVPGIAGMAKAVVLTEQQTNFLARCQEWKESFLDHITSKLQPVLVNGDVTGEGTAPYIISLSFPGLKSEVLVHALEEEGVFVSSKSACSSKLETPSRVLKAMGRTDQEALSSIRISMGYDTTKEEIEQCAEALIRVVPKLQQVVKVR
ncbi:cysteine desulfurase family protein [Thermoflavimicrobium dichotomicum]|uniref:Cysteine desulfurase n=1 Tax=Thermoflavimicrobium dichotomicum TaxID=46223 RepID=A0A1I3NDS8_9BACL|nr:cysteine desulfurase family protein [Thermoflavimicrobium dichotomicum]SFJ07521.1 cysteine desulfurase [Thermoflavimicrobium dichotomicum]